MTAQIKAIIAGLVVLVVLIIAGLVYWRGSSNATTKADLRAARTVIKTERTALKVTTATNERVDAESVQTAQTAEAADHEIEALRTASNRSRPGAARPGASSASAPREAAGSVDPFAWPGVGTPADVTDVDPSAARVLQLAREARAAALASSARLQPARAGAR